MTTFYIDTGGATNNSGSTDTNSHTLTGSAATVAGSVITLDGSPDLSGLSTSGATQSTIHLTDATNSNQKIFKITAFDNTAKTVTVSVAPTGVTSSVWHIGGRLVWTPAAIEAAFEAGDLIIQNNDIASSSTAILTCRTSGSNTARIIWRGKSGAKRKMTETTTAPCITGTVSHWTFENLEFVQQGATGSAVSASITRGVYIDCKISDAGSSGGFAMSTPMTLVNCEVTGSAGPGVSSSGGLIMTGCYIHDCTGNGVTFSSTNLPLTMTGCIIDTCGGKGIVLTGAASTGAATVVLNNCTVYGCGDSGFESVTDDDYIALIQNCIFQDNGNAAGEYNFETNNNAGYTHLNNVFYLSSGANNVSGITLNEYWPGELTTDPGFTNAASGDFSISFAGSARGAGYPGLFPGGLVTGYPDIGAVKRQETAAGGLVRNPGFSGGFV